MVTQLKVEMIDPRKLIPYVNNPREHPESQVVKLMASIKEFGVVLPVLIDDDDMIIAGHGVVLAAIRLEVETVPCVRGGHLTEGQRRAYVIADNRLAEDSAWDKEKLSAEMLRLRDDFGISLEITGFAKREILSLNLDYIGGKTPEDGLPKEDPRQVTIDGDLWLLGEHSIICGDSTNAETVSRLFDGARPHLMVTDPPYGVKYKPSWRILAGVSDSKRTGEVMNDDRSDWRGAWALFPGDVAYVWHAALHGISVVASLAVNDFVLRSQIIWAKPNLVLGRGDIHWQHEACFYALRFPELACPEAPGYCDGYESCWYAVREGETSHWQGSRKISTLWDIEFATEDAKTVHGTQKPVECMRRPMLNSSHPGDYVYEPFCGSGTAIIAAQSCRRRCLAVELDPKYVDVAVRRWQNYTGKSAIHTETGKTFDVLKRERKR